ncbi:AcrR family transcriptional regulator [Parvibaculum indicum]|uniref:TetR/AcrR family transcriptional regulator n=1 Tax=Parvibaculum indicum TaxID=562969 RepID=UPI00141F70D6|nr:TetR/AcrR family transcriptional regulator [Parvibaculum indicum]NIJ41882.1 AcrR family transcriptional regulator [Parvibaculum indicum]
MVRLEPKPRSEAAQHLKQIACRLFAERGVDGVTVREIAEAAGQKNHAAVGYHFGSKEALIREIVLDGAILIDEYRNALLDALEAQGGPSTVREVVEVLIRSSVRALEGSQLENSYNRFVTMLGMTHRDFFMETLDGKWNSGYLRCLDHLRRLETTLTPSALNQRFVFMGAYLGSVISAREAALSDASRQHPTWSADETLTHLAVTLTALLEAPAPADSKAPRLPDPDPVVLGPLGILPG